jgi:hypothetical protein
MYQEDAKHCETLIFGGEEPLKVKTSKKKHTGVHKYTKARKDDNQNTV